MYKHFALASHRHRHQPWVGPKYSNVQSGLASASNSYSQQFTNKHSMYIHMYYRTREHQHGDRRGIGIGLRQGMTVATYKVLWHRQATLIHENLQSVSASATNSYLWQMTKCFSIGIPHSFAAINKVCQHWQKTFG